MRLRNWIEDRNLFKMAPPPQWWMQAVFAFDPDIRILPSREGMKFWLTRVKKVAPELGLSSRSLDKALGHQQIERDTGMFLFHKVEPVFSVVSPSGEWSVTNIIARLKAMDTWADDGPMDVDAIRRAMANGGSNFTKRVERLDNERRQRIDAQNREMFWHASGDAWSSRQFRTGRKVLNAGTTPPGAPPPQPKIIIAGA